MPFYEREEKILQALIEAKALSVDEIAKKLYISIPTVRRDLIKLENRGLIIRTRGGAVLKNESADSQIPLFMREREQNEAKRIMAKKAVEFISDGDTVMLDATTSAYSVISCLSEFDNLLVITSGAKASVALGSMGINNISTGGKMITESLSFVGKDAENTILNYNADVLMFSCRSLSEDGYLSDNSIEENIIRRAMMSRAKKKIFLCDSTKLGKISLNNLCHISDVDEIISETDVPENILNMMK